MILSLDDIHRLKNTDINKYFRELTKGADNDIEEYEQLFKLEQMAYDTNGQIYDSKQIEFYKERADNEKYIYKCSCFIMGLLYFTGVGVENNINISKKYLKKAIEKQYGPAYNIIGNMYYNEKQYGKAKECYCLGIKYGSIASISNMGMMYAFGICVEQSYEQAFYYYDLAAKSNNHHALYSVGNMYHRGLFVPKDISKAIDYYMKAAENKQKDAAHALGQLYNEGKHVEKDIVKAVYYYVMAHSYYSAKNVIFKLIEQNDIVTLKRILADISYIELANIYTNTDIPEYIINWMNEAKAELTNLDDCTHISIDI